MKKYIGIISIVSVLFFYSVFSTVRIKKLEKLIDRSMMQTDEAIELAVKYKKLYYENN